MRYENKQASQEAKGPEPHSNVSAIGASVNPTLDDVYTFLEKKAESGELPKNTARNRASALRHLVEILRDDEPRDPPSVLHVIEELAGRFATLNSGLPAATVCMYQTRAKRALADYLAWREDPTKFKFVRRGTGGLKTKKRTASKANQDEATPVQPSAPPAEARHDAKPGASTTVRLDGERAITIACHGDGPFFLRDIKRAALAGALAFAEDFDIDSSAREQVFSIQR